MGVHGIRADGFAGAVKVAAQGADRPSGRSPSPAHGRGWLTRTPNLSVGPMPYSVKPRFWLASTPVSVIAV
jgi:hypothetical protein